MAGSRTWTNWGMMEQILDLWKDDITELVSGTAKGADEMGEWWATKNGISIKRFPADWSRYGKGAGYIRNKEMAQYADGLFAFWDGKSKGTGHMIDLAKKHDLHVEIIIDELIN